MTTGLPMDRRPDPQPPQDVWSALRVEPNHRRHLGSERLSNHGWSRTATWRPAGGRSTGRPHPTVSASARSRVRWSEPCCNS